MYAFNRTNPFLDMLAALGEAETQTSEEQNNSITTNRVQDIKLPEFLPHAPALWFSCAECLFTLKNVTDDVLKYCSVVANLPHDVLRQVADLLDIEKLERLYVQLKERLMSAHELTPVQCAKRMMQTPDLGAQRSSPLCRPCWSGAHAVRSHHSSLLLFSAASPMSCVFCLCMTIFRI
jgi:hypothetical protein